MFLHVADDGIVLSDSAEDQSDRVDVSLRHSARLQPAGRVMDWLRARRSNYYLALMSGSDMPLE